MYNKTGSRNPGLDILRCIALFCVVAVHFFLNTINYDLFQIQGWTAFLVLLLRGGFLICVPLFLLLSGYLMGNRTPTRSYYRKLTKTLGIYVLASLCCVAFSLLYNLILHKQMIDIGESLMGILSFTAAPYSWYIEMYIGLFLLIPYLNILYNHIDSPENKRNFILTLLVLTALPSVVNIHRWDSLQWWLQPSSSHSYTQLIPGWWTGIYPLTYYYLGCYLREFPLKMSRRSNLYCILAVYLLFGVFNYYRSYNSTFVAGAWQDYSSLFVVLLSVLVFSWVVQADYSKMSEKTAKTLAYLSDLTLGAYLVSWIFDRVVYGIITRLTVEIPQRLPFILVSVPFVYVCSMVLSAVLNSIYRRLAGLLSTVRKRLPL